VSKFSHYFLSGVCEILWGVGKSLGGTSVEFKRANASGVKASVFTLFLAVGVATSSCSLVIKIPKPSSNLNSALSTNLGILIKLLPVYPLHANWNDYVHFTSGLAATPYNQADSDCLGTENGYFGCVHGGEKRRFSVPGYASCAGLTAQDNLGVFNWVCNSSQNPVVFYSRAFNAGKGLKDLINSSNLQFNPLGVTVTNASGTVVATALPSLQWSNPIVNILPTLNSAASITTLPGSASPGTIYALNSGTATLSAGFLMPTDRTSLVTLGNSTFQWAGVGGNNCFANTMQTMVCPTGKYQWLEGSFDGYNAGGTVGVGIRDVSNYSRRHLLKIQNAGIGVASSDHNLYDQTSIANTTSTGLSGVGGNFQQFYNITLNNVTAGINFDGMANTIMNGVFGSNISGAGFAGGVGGGTLWKQNTITQMTFLNGGGPTFELKSAAGRFVTQNTFAHFTFLNAPGPTTLILSELANGGTHTQNVHSDIVIANFPNFGWAISLDTVSNGAFYDLLLNGNGGGSRGVNNVSNNSSTNMSFDGSIRMNGFAAPCVNTAATFYMNNGCQYGPTFTENVVQGVSLTSSFQGIVASDPVNQSSGGGLGNQAYAVAPTTPAMDFFNFTDSLFRGWGYSGVAGFLDTSRMGACSGGQNCQMYDSKLLASDSIALNFYGAMSASLPNCPTSVDGAGDIYPAGGPNPTIIHDSNGHYYLKNAVEIQFDDAPGANNNGLCESGEKCIYAPNSGAYQGEGDFTAQTCIFHNGPSDGTHLQNVTLYYYPVNGS